MLVVFVAADQAVKIAGYLVAVAGIVLSFALNRVLSMPSNERVRLLAASSGLPPRATVRVVNGIALAGLVAWLIAAERTFHHG
jgi:hypothetical protein